MDETISVLIPVYNCEAYLARCVQSVLAQKMPVFEIILVNDGSQDHSGAVCDALAEKDSRIHVVHLAENRGVAAARNVALDMAQGEWLSFVDADDYISPVMLETLYLACKQWDVPLAQCRNLRTENDTEPTPAFHLDEVASIYTGKDIHRKLSGDNSGYVRCMLWATLYKRTLFAGLRFPEGIIHEDEALAHHILHRAGRMASLDVQLYFYYGNQNSIMKQQFNRARFSVLDILRERTAFYQKLGWHDIAYLTQLRYQLSILDCYEGAKKWIPSSEKEQQGLLALYRNGLADLDGQTWTDAQTKGELLHFAENIADKPAYSFLYVQQWLKRHPEILV